MVYALVIWGDLLYIGPCGVRVRCIVICNLHSERLLCAEKGRPTLSAKDPSTSWSEMPDEVVRITLTMGTGAALRQSYSGQAFLSISVVLVAVCPSFENRSV